MRSARVPKRGEPAQFDDAARFSYPYGMEQKSDRLSMADVLDTRERRLEMQRLQEIEGNPLDAEDVAMFEMFERERWTHERCRAYILEKAGKAIVPHAAE